MGCTVIGSPITTRSQFDQCSSELHQTAGWTFTDFAEASTVPSPNSAQSARGRDCCSRLTANLIADGSTELGGRFPHVRETSAVSVLRGECQLLASTWSRKPCNPSTTRSARGCHPCLRYHLLPMSPGWTVADLVEGEGLDPPTSAFFIITR
jgi:hypothetical protein